MRFNMLQLLKNLRSRSQGKEFTDADILNWANKKVKITGRTSHMDSFKVSKFNIPFNLFINFFPYRLWLTGYVCGPLFRIRTFQTDYSFLNFSALSSQGLSIGTL